MEHELGAMMRGRIDEYLSRHEREIHRDILRLVAVPSVSEDRSGTRKALAEFLSLARSMGFSVREAAGGDVGVATIEPDELGSRSAPETLGILAHVDVVDPGDSAAWSRSPWGELADAAVWGRGTLDDKGPLVICLWAVKALRDLGLPFRKRVSFVVGTMEEIDWLDMDAYRKEATLPDFGFTPDGEFPVINREKGFCDVCATFDRGLHGRLGDFQIVDFEAGTAANVVPDSARALLRPAAFPVLGDGACLEALQAALEKAPESERSALSVEAGSEGLVIVKARGRAVHSSVPEQGDNALLRLCLFLARLGRNGLIDFLADNFAGDPYARGLALQTRPEWIQGEFVGPTTASPDLLRSTSEAFAVSINLRLAFGQTREELAAVFDAGRARYGYSFSLEQYMPALFISKDRPFMKALLSAYEGATGAKGEFVLAPGTSYAKAMPRVAAFGPVLPGHPDLCHMADERMSFNEVRACARIYADAVAAIVSSPYPMA